MRKIKFFLVIMFVISNAQLLFSQQSSVQKRFKVLALAENGGHHIRYTQAAKVWLNKLAADSSFSIDYIQTSVPINEQFLSQYQLFIQLDFPPYTWSGESMKAFINYIEKGKGGWIGFHHATLLGEFDGYPMWNWYSDFMGGIAWKNYIADFATAKVKVEDQTHPIMTGLPKEFIIEKEEWYTYDKSPRANVHVIASVDESTYSPDSKVKMGDHPVIWSNSKMAARNVYIFMGHSPDLFNNELYTKLFRNAIFWAAKK
ncbi:MAG TPA: ThuA domain-containing protein [Chryseolinea sp.]|nr:ThuA domain-containing protein [Chryseolinea sp.]